MKKLILFLAISLSLSLATFAHAQKIEKLSKEVIAVAKPSLPDISGYTGDTIQNIQTSFSKKGAVRIASLTEFREQTRLFYSDKFGELTKLQKMLPRVIVIEDGNVNFDYLAQNSQEFVQKIEAKTYLVKLPIIVAANAALTIDNGRKIYLSRDTGSFIFVGGRLFVNNSSIIAWHEKARRVARYSGDETQFRPFIMAYSGGALYLNKSHFESLGYQASGAYGISLRAITSIGLGEIDTSTKPHLLNAPTGWIIDSTFKDLYFGFYSYAAKNVVILRNRYINNVIYGIDPHDYSSNLIIAYNRVSGTQKMHGIIGSRFVNNSYIMHNDVSTSGRSGIMLDRQSGNNVIAFNKSYNNGGDGITVYESNNNLVYGNQAFKNQDHGIRVRNSIDISLQYNVVLGNRKTGIYFHTRDLGDHDYRDLTLDPYEQRVNGIIVGGLIVGNQSGGVFAENIESVGLSELRVEQNGNAISQFRGDLMSLESDIVVNLWEPDSAIMVRPNAQ
jgi:poly(beta-D-mannuronate) C5 epimerase